MKPRWFTPILYAFFMALCVLTDLFVQDPDIGMDAFRTVFSYGRRRRYGFQ